MRSLAKQQPLAESLLSEDQEDSLPEKDFFQRAFSPIKQGAMRGSIFALLASAMGTGMFNLPFRIHEIGIIPYFFFVACGGFFSYLGMHLISEIILKFRVQSYSEMSQKSYGNTLKKLAEFCLIIYPWGITVCFQVIFAKFMVQLLDDTFQLGFYEDGGRSQDKYSSEGNLARILINVGAIALNMFFILKKEIGILQKVSMVGVAAVIINVAIILVTFIVGFHSKNCQGEDCDYSGITGINWANLTWFSLADWQDVSLQVQGLASIIFCYVNHQLVFPLCFDLKNPTKKRLGKIFHRVHLTEFIIYNVVGISGYLLLSQHQNQIPIAPVVMASIQTTTMAIGKLFMIVSLFFAVPLNLFPARTVIFEAFALEANNKNHVIISLALGLSGTMIAIVFQQVNSYFGLLGGTAGVMMAGGIPMICYYKYFGVASKTAKAMMAFMIVISIFGVAGAMMSVIDPQ